MKATTVGVMDFGNKYVAAELKPLIELRT